MLWRVVIDRTDTDNEDGANHDFDLPSGLDRLLSVDCLMEVVLAFARSTMFLNSWCNDDIRWMVECSTDGNKWTIFAGPFVP